MDHSNSPFSDRSLRTPEMDMLNAALPYVSDKMRKNLALYIKLTEMKQIFYHFDSEELLSACGLKQDSPDPEAMLRAMKMAGGKNSNPQIDQMLQMMNMIKTYKKINDLMQANPELMAFLNSMMSQSIDQDIPCSAPNSSPDQTPPHFPPSFNNHFSPQDLLDQLVGKDSSDIMTLLAQMLKNSR